MNNPPCLPGIARRRVHTGFPPILASDGDSHLPLSCAFCSPSVCLTAAKLIPVVLSHSIQVEEIDSDSRLSQHWSKTTLHKLALNTRLRLRYSPVFSLRISRSFNALSAFVFTIQTTFKEFCMEPVSCTMNLPRSRMNELR